MSFEDAMEGLLNDPAMHDCLRELHGWLESWGSLVSASPKSCGF